MAVTGDWTVVEGDHNNNGPLQEVIRAAAATELATRTTIVPPLPKAAVRFPCMEQPPRYALRSAKTGHYLGGTKKGRLVGRNKRTENDEWTMALVGGDNSQAGTNSSTATIHNHKFGNILSVVLTDATDLGRKAACVKPETAATEQDHDLGLGEEEATEEEEEAPREQLPDDENENGHLDADNDDSMGVPRTAEKEDMQWCVIRCSGDNDDNSNNKSNGGVMIVSTKTGDCLSVTDKGQIILSPYEPFHVWEMECVTGELCFLSNPALDARVRCDMAGLLTLSPNWKGWEVVRITEVAAAHAAGSQNNNNNNSDNNNNSGYVRISSWMHSQWFLCSDASGTVGTCSVSESLLGPPAGVGTQVNDYRCSKWAIEAYPTDENSKHRGLILRSVTHGRLLSIQDGLLRTYDSLDEMRQADNNAEFINNTDSNTDSNTASTDDTSAAVTNTAQGDAIGDLVKHHTDEMKKRTEEMKRKGSNWWKQSLTNVQKTISDSAIQRRNSKMMANGELSGASAGQPIPVEETIVWQLETAHLQTYYFLSSEVALQVPNGEEDNVDSNLNASANANSNQPQPPRSIGAFPTLTENLRKSDKIQLVRNDASPYTLKLYLPDEKFYVKCSSKGSILATKQEEDEGTEWIMEENEKGSVFRSKPHGLYLSFREEESKTPPAAAFAAASSEEGGESSEHESNASPRNKGMKNPFENLKILPHQKRKPRVAELCATETPGIWNLEPCTPRAISSKRLKTFAIGTSIAVGTTIAMPFAIAGVAAAMGALGAEAGIGFGIVAAAATGAEAIASVGAIGATAYFCFRPEQNSLGDDLEESANANPWSKRPFGNWRNW